MSVNLAYGLIGIAYSLLLAFLRSDIQETQPLLTGERLENEAFIQSIAWFPWYFVVTMVLLLVFARWQLRDTSLEGIEDSRARG